MSETSLIIKCEDVVINKDRVGEALADLLHSTPAHQVIACKAMLQLINEAGTATTSRPPAVSRSVSTDDHTAAIGGQLVWNWAQDRWEAFCLIDIVDNAQAKRCADSFKDGSNSFYIQLEKHKLVEFRDKLTKMIEIWEKYEPSPGNIS
jgi:hypothetical protein